MLDISVEIQQYPLLLEVQHVVVDLILDELFEIHAELYLYKLLK